jgi:hypothetical protein
LYKRPTLGDVDIVAEEKKTKVDIVRVDSDSLRNRKGYTVLNPSYATFLVPRTQNIVVIFANELSLPRKRWCLADN